MGRPRIQHKCRECGEPTERRGRWMGGFRCIDCAIAAAVELQRQFAERKGEYYEKWAFNLAAAMDERRKLIADHIARSDQAPPR